MLELPCSSGQRCIIYTLRCSANENGRSGMYLWLKAAHIIFVVSWIASLLVYPRYKLHQMSGQPGGELFETMQLASARLRRIIMTPSLIAVWIFGIGLLSINPNVFAFKWMWVKFAVVVFVTGLHGFYVKTGKAIDRGDATISAKKLKLANELPFIALIVIVVMVVVRPF